MVWLYILLFVVGILVVYWLLRALLSSMPVVIILLVGATVFAVVATFGQYGAQSFAHPVNLSLRQMSLRPGASWFAAYSGGSWSSGGSRSYRGGGLSSGK